MGQWLHWVLQDAFSAAVLGAIVLGICVIGLAYRVLHRIVKGSWP